MIRKEILLLLLHLFFSFYSMAQLTEKIETDRPDQTESPFLVPLRYFQAEFGLTVQRFENDLKQVQHPTALLKYGLSKRMELRLEATPYTEFAHSIPTDKKTVAIEPVEVGAKIRLWEEKGLLPKTSLIAHIGLPFLASKEFRHTDLSYTTRLTLQNTLSETVSLGYNIGVERDIDGNTAAFYTFAPGFSLSPKWYAYVEAFGTLTGPQTDHNVDGGLAYSPTSNTKIDVSGGFGPGSSPLRNYYALGFSFRLPLH